MPLPENCSAQDEQKSFSPAKNLQMPPRQIIRYALVPVVLTTLLLASLLLARSGTGSQEKAKAPANTQRAQATSVSSAPLDTALAQEIDRAIDQSDQTQARWGVFVMSMKDDRVLYSRNGDRLFTPASNMKIYTTAVALELLGAEYRWRTSVYVDKQPDAQGTISGDITLYGRGSPDLVAIGKVPKPSLAQFADQLYQSGVRNVRGNVIGDESYFRGDLFGLGWQWNDLQWYFGAEPSALTIDENSFEVTIAPAKKTGDAASVALNRDTGFVHLLNNTNTAERDATTTIGINRGLSSNELRVWGDFPVGGRSFSAFLSVHNPALWAATLFKKALIARGIKVDGEVRSRDARAPEKERFDPQKAFEIAYQDSATLGEIARQTNKESNNLFAELILRTLGKERGESAPDPDPRKNRERGDDQAGSAVIKSWLDRNSIPNEGLAIRDGSGLSRLDLVTPEATTRLLVAMGKTNSATIFHDSLPIAGRDGTLSSRLKSAAGRVFAKTGTISYVHSLSGYAVAENGEVLAFSIFCNDATGRTNPVRLIDDIAHLLTSYPKTAAQK